MSDLEVICGTILILALMLGFYKLVRRQMEIDG
jgi:hypothetical protein